MFLYLSDLAVQKLAWRNSQIEKYYQKYPDSNKNSNNDYNYIANSRKHESPLEVRKRIFLNANLDFNKYKDNNKSKDPYQNPNKLFVTNIYQKTSALKNQKTLASLGIRKNETDDNNMNNKKEERIKTNFLDKINENFCRSPLPKKLKEQKLLLNKIFSPHTKMSNNNDHKSHLYKYLSPSNISNHSLNENNIVEFLSGSIVPGISSYTSLEKSQNIDDSIIDSPGGGKLLTLSNIKYSNLKSKLYNNSSNNFDNSKTQFIITSIPLPNMNTIPQNDHDQSMNRVDLNNLKTIRNDHYTSIPTISTYDSPTKIGPIIDALKIVRINVSPKIK